MGWNKEQEYSFTARGGTLLVSAAAGSGKTAVLVERVIRMLTGAPDEEGKPTMPPVDVDRLLIVTYTRAAAAEMRQRLSEVLAEKMAAEPDNLNYVRQQMLLPRAYISTVHGFCSRLLQEFSAQAELPVGFSIAEEGQTKLLKAEALDAVLEQSYRQRDPAFMELTRQLCSHKNDRDLRKAVLKAHEFMQAQPHPEVWLQKQMDAYTQVLPLEQSGWMQPILTEMDLALERMIHYAQHACQIAQDHQLDFFSEKLQMDVDNLNDFREQLPVMTYDQLYQRVRTLSLQRMSGGPRKLEEIQIEGKARLKEVREAIKERNKKLMKLFPGDEQQCREDLAFQAPVIEAFCHLVGAFSQQFIQLKRQQKWLDYSDLEHEALRLLVAEDGCATPLAQEVAGRFEEVMVDEYQDTNAAQDALFEAITNGGENLFMVGDVKQSIYGFRQAMPSIFIDRRDRYAPYDPDNEQFPATITLGRNYRSRKEVTDTVNYIFRQLMSRRLGGVEYDRREELIPSLPYPPQESTTEWCLLDQAEAEAQGLTEVQREARLIGQRIKELMATMTVTRKKQEEDPKLNYKDICILNRLSKDMPVFVKELNQMGIPVAVDKGEAFLSTPEVRTALSLLRVIDNPLRDVALAAVMLSPLYGFTTDDLAQIRLGAPNVPLYVAVTEMAEQSDRTELAGQAERFLASLRRFRTLAVSLPADRLLETVMRETDMEAVFAARSAGSQRVANLQQLDRVARRFEQGGFRGLSAFVRYVDRVEESGEDLPSGDTLQQDGVRLMTIHGSKGLEFPVVFVARLNYHKRDDTRRDNLLLHAEAGIALKLVNETTRERHTPLSFYSVGCAKRLDDAAELLRVWYVALTRAREKLILTYSMNEPEQTLAELEQELPEQGALLPDTILGETCPGALLLAACLRHPDFAEVHQTGRVPLCPDESRMAVVLRPELKQPEENDDSDGYKADPEMVKRLKERRDYAYGYAPLLGVPAKLAASQLSHQKMSREHVAKARPAFLQAEGLTPAQKGTAMHTFMQFADYEAASSDLLAEIDRLTAAGFLTLQQATSLNMERLSAFFAGDLYRRMSAALRVWREYPFAVMVPAGMVDGTLPAELTSEEVLVQGIADCVFQEEDGLTLVDYKTDRVKTGQELIDRYRSQMVFYRQALETILGLPVKEMLLYSFALDKTVEVK
ncbi:MAG: helicase-exonuclease AddAB subunit AddA [Ruminococcaceae bacterium]|nr:helicase-exonuclease AddAB subunit AddA [Oscillospiraceae bacterium]